jgi:hypothetical protein
MHVYLDLRVTVMGNVDLSPTPFRPYATWLDEEPEVRSAVMGGSTAVIVV